ncbi:hypothetical protein BGZ70_003697 [Mortierella alpina]|uniref:F-box domain-containing protein n=1 Tax=Mortierella alpina TaxID=64518 RepID=A0A9P6LV11_MORAP|nr:hypothetical protein BGZ70_003697 [Mortierella alpina]
MDLPEIRTHVARHLADEHLAAAAAVSKGWHDAFNPAYWATVKWSSDEPKRPTEVGIEANKHSIRSLSIECDHPVDSALNSCTNLTTLNVHYCSDNWDRVSNLLRQNTLLTSLSLYYSRVEPPPEFLTSLNESCKNLTHLDASNLVYNFRGTQLLLDLTTRLHYLNLNGSELTDVGPLDSGENHQRWPEFPHLKTLSLLLDSPGITMLHQTQWFRKCPQLRDLHWFIDEDDDGQERLPMRELSQLFSQDCPLLDKLELEHPKLTDDALNRILAACRPLKKFDVSRSKFGPLAFQSLGQHFATLTNLDLARCPAVTSPMTQRILMSCPNLLWFCSGRLEAQDILGVTESMNGTHEGYEEQPLQPQDWVCTKLRLWTMYLCGLENRPSTWQDLVLKQLSKLTQLDFLTFGVNDYSLDGTRDGIQLSLDAGLDQLRTLTKLDRFCFDGVAQDMTEKDVRWMLETWPKLERVEGRLHTDNEQRRELEKILLARDVQMCIYYDDDPEEDEQDDGLEEGDEHGAEGWEEDAEGGGEVDDEEDDEEVDEEEEDEEEEEEEGDEEAEGEAGEDEVGVGKEDGTDEEEEREEKEEF